MTLTLRAWIAGLGAALCLGAPELARACAVCTSGTEEASRLAFILTTVFLSILPLVMLGAVLWWLWRRTRQLERDAAHPDHSSQPADIARTFVAVEWKRGDARLNPSQGARTG